jgi:hypothetical protein
VLEAIGAGATRRSRIADLAGQRVDLPLETLRRGGSVRRSTPVGAVRRTPPLYELADPHLRFWFFVLGHLVERIQGGEGEAVLERQWPRWQQHVGWTFEEVARAHARRLVTAGSLPLDTLIGRWWSTTGVEAEIDVVGMQGGRTALLGEARWSRRGFDQRDVARLEELSARLPDARDALFGFWSRGDVPRPRGDRAIRCFGVEEALGRPGAALAG